MLSFSISSYRECCCCLRSVCHREHKLFSLGCSDSMIGVYKQSYQKGWHVPTSPHCIFLHSTALFCTLGMCALACSCSSPSIPVSLSVSQLVTQASTLGILVQLIIQHPETQLIWNGDTERCRLVKEPQILSLASAPFLVRACISVCCHCSASFRINVTLCQRAATTAVVVQMWDWLISGGRKLRTLLTAAHYPCRCYPYFIVCEGGCRLRITPVWQVADELFVTATGEWQDECDSFQYNIIIHWELFLLTLQLFGLILDLDLP